MLASAAIRRKLEITPSSPHHVGLMTGMGRHITEDDFDQLGYSVEEYEISGEVHGAGYRTSLLIRRPSNIAHFSGVVLLETVHAAGHITIWPGAWQYLIRHGHGYAKVVSQQTSLEGAVKGGNPDRYAELVIPDPAVLYEGTTGFPPGFRLSGARDVLADSEFAKRAEAMRSGIGVSVEIMSQAGALIKSDESLFGTPVQKLVMAGISQTGAQTIAFIESGHPAARMPDGSYIYDGFLPHAAFGDKPIPPSGVPVMHVIDEAEVRMPPLTHRRPDGDTAKDQYRLYEIAGCPHVATRGMSREAVSTFFAGVAGQESQGNLPEGIEPSQFPASMLYRATFSLFFDWVTKGMAPPHAEPILTDAEDQIVFDGHGNARGGVRSSLLDVPTAKYVGTFVGTQVPFEPSKLRALYGDEASYAARVSESVDQMVSAGFLLADDADELRAEAKTFSFGRRLNT